MPVWGPQQEDALKKVGRWLRNDTGQQQIFRMFGYAGTGKTTLAKYLAESVSGSTIFAAYTGKAASVLKASGAPNAQTLHSLIYTPQQSSRERLDQLKTELEDVQRALREHDDGSSVLAPERLQHYTEREAELKGEVKLEERNAQRPSFNLKLDSPLRDADLLVVDECSMVDEDMANDIMSFGTPILVLGDPGQLPPVRGTGYFTDATPDVMLTEIHRQAKDNPIIYLATCIRNGEALKHGKYGESQIIARATPEIALASDQVLVGRNKTRVATNIRMRSLLGFTNRFPSAGEKLVCLRNDREHGLLNGTLHIAAADSEEVAGFLNLRIRPEENPDAEPLLVPAHIEHFCGNPDDIGYWHKLSAQEFTYGYALTCHKSQGSQWRNVLIIDESAAFNPSSVRQRWLYTAVTRASEVVTLVRD